MTELFENLYLVRHGESTCNSVHRIAGTRDAPLTFLGRAQARQAADDGRRTGFDRIYVSPLARASETADIIFGADAATDPRIVLDERLMERDFGSYTLQCKAILQRRHGVAEYERAMNGDSDTMTGGQTAAEFAGRVREFYDEELLPALRRGETVCVVSHKYVVELICRFILGRTEADAFDLRLPNSQLLHGDRIHRYVRTENRHRNMLYDWIVVNHPLVFCLGLAAGLLGNLAGLRFSASPYLLLALLVAASVITMCRIELERAREFLTDPGIIRTTVVRYLGLPVLAAGVVAWLGPEQHRTAAIVAVFLATPSSVVAMTVSRCLGGMIMPAFAHVLLSSLAAAAGFGVVLAVTVPDDAVRAVAIAASAATGIVVVAYLLVRQLRLRAPIRTAKFGERNAYVAVLILTAFIVLVSLRIELGSFVEYGPVAIGIAVGLRLLAMLLRRRNHLQALDDYLAMTYPNVFVIVVVAALTGDSPLEHVAIWCLLPMFALSWFDSRYATSLVADGDDPRWSEALHIPATGPGARSALR
ncbi:histidine phosphatase family protein [Catenuloplanes japonicus]|uniref:histidine phosphatase family protein n=1 Tax=Catenuloplanes japonicus TaxID=33876 RepID=UPI00068D9999|nr:histidine phosphatase family protein [Catenuloplanes japonicus]